MANTEKHSGWRIFGWTLVAIGALGFIGSQYGDILHGSYIAGRKIAGQLPTVDQTLGWKIRLLYEYLFVAWSLMTGITILHRESILAKRPK